MTFINSRRPRLESTFFPLMDIAQRLGVHHESLIQQAAHGKVKLFVRIPKGLTPYSVHQHAIDTSDPLIRADKVAHQLRAPDPLDSMPVSMGTYGLVGLLLNPMQCGKLLHERFLRLSLFDQGVRLNMIYGDYVDPIGRNLFFKKSRLGTDGWRLACYSSSHGPTFIEGIGYSQPEEFEIELNNVFAIATSVDQFLDDVDTNRFISDLVVDGHIVHIDDRPTYFSERLNQVLDAHWFYLRALEPLQIKIKNTVWDRKNVQSQLERKNRNEVIASVRTEHDRTVALLSSDEFRAHLQKNQTADKLIRAAARFITPQYARGLLGEFTAELRDFDLETALVDPFPLDPEMQNPMIPPEVKALVAGAKLFWGHPSLDLANPNSHPDRRAVVNFMKDLGLSAIDAESAATIISHKVMRGRPPAAKSATKSRLASDFAHLHKLRPK